MGKENIFERRPSHLVENQQISSQRLLS
jgi:hypothetical protein